MRSAARSDVFRSFSVREIAFTIGRFAKISTIRTTAPSAIVPATIQNPRFERRGSGSNGAPSSSRS